MKNEKDEKSNRTNSRWSMDHFSIHAMQAEYVDSFRRADKLLDSKRFYRVEYDVDLLPSGDAMSVRLYVLVNSEGLLPGYRIQCTVQSDFRHRDYPQDISVDLVIPKDLGFLIMSTYDSMQDQLLSLTGEMPLGAYILPPPDLNGSIRHKLREFLD